MAAAGVLSSDMSMFSSSLLGFAASDLASFDAAPRKGKINGPAIKNQTLARTSNFVGVGAGHSLGRGGGRLLVLAAGVLAGAVGGMAVAVVGGRVRRGVKVEAAEEGGKRLKTLKISRRYLGFFE